MLKITALVAARRHMGRGAEELFLVSVAMDKNLGVRLT